MSAWMWVALFGAVLLLAPIILILFYEFMMWWLDNTVGRLLDWLGL